ncbi:retinaldehyde-binding protein 1, partial [Trichonephila clavipes]
MLWGRQVAETYPPTNKNTLIRALTEEWDKLPQQLLDNVCNEKYGNWNSDDIEIEALFCTLAAILFSLVNYPANQISGARVIYDAKNYSFKQMRAFIPKYLTFIDKALR